MNDLIIKLSEQADNMADDYLQMQGEYHPDWHDVRDQFFVELIIQECSHALHPMLRDMISRGDALHLIEKHFKVK